jgi:D-beta-D-heptose 7-phosphate kinase/D-beta-D-heptose 1-phosphate adenosyltransferase
LILSSLFSEQECEVLAETVAPVLNEQKVMVLSDYNKGTLSNAQHWISLAKQRQMKVLVDPKGTDFSKYTGADLITPNMAEFEAVVGKVTSEADLIEKAQALID